MSNVHKIFSIALLTVIGFVGASVPVRADHRDNKCEQRIHKAEENLRKAIDRHGEHSKQAHKRREQLEEARRSCGYRDHDRDRDRDHH